jgi:oligopeptide/dipeptide ABC transporter ATP-binding protein
MSMMFQDPVGSLSPRMTVGDLVTEPFRIHGIEGRDLRAETDRLLSLVGLTRDFASRFPHQLSGGQARRVGVARAIALDPALVIADEPTAGLDVSVQGEVLNLLNDLRERLGLAMLIITHNLHVVHHVADRVAVMYLGRFVETGTTEEVFDRPAHPYTAALLSANPEPDPDRAHDRIALPAEVPSLLDRPSGCEFHTRCPWVQDTCRTRRPPWSRTAPPPRLPFPAGARRAPARANGGNRMTEIEVHETVWIPMPDGTQLAARLWLPASARQAPVPCILEYIPYRRRDRTRMRDESMHPHFAAAGYAAIRVDIRGYGDSDGVAEDEYSHQEIRTATT